MTKQPNFVSIALFVIHPWQQLAYVQNLHTISYNSEVVPEVHSCIPNPSLLGISHVLQLIWPFLSLEFLHLLSLNLWVLLWTKEHNRNLINNCILYEIMGTNWLIYCPFQITCIHWKAFHHYPLKNEANDINVVTWTYQKLRYLLGR